MSDNGKPSVEAAQDLVAAVFRWLVEEGEIPADAEPSETPETVVRAALEKRSMERMVAHAAAQLEAIAS